MKRHLLSTIAIAPFATGAAIAQESEPVATAEPLPPAALPESEAPKVDDRVSINVGAGVVTEYISRGVMFAEEVSLQPSVTISLDVADDEGGLITDADVFVGSWASIKLGSVPAGPAGRLTRFYETDLYAGAAIQLAERWNISATYYRYESLGDSFEGYNDLEMIATYDDTGAWDGVPLENFSLSPSLRLVQEAGRPGREDALYIQPSLTPSFDAQIGGEPIHVAIPLMVGLSDEYYDGIDGGKETFGFFRTGLALSGQPARDSLPGLTLTGAVDLWVPNSEVASGIDEYDVVGRIGLNWSL
ncbi:hypothetical protein SAMN06297468_0009 [Altererythrobacter xiamenensis]|uniref:MetA-pathway of phenol degradation n=1 Tax=Altererythrobacter xiamenensis TaxID=1316679 RepID=A0A1Y6E4F2_9SPHN|nr:hypothetical protein [Altererythrobacter xiamenensis]SMQ57665.1 hypothetical protein SAMN06297468_0009 [Altererythrobacter xiamenensis]